MIILPAIDFFDGKAVRLYKGDYSQMTVYDDNPVNTARKFRESGARWIHMVDLQGARDGGTPNMEVAAGIMRETGLKAEIGGGIRSLDVIERYIDGGFSRVILGTAAVTDRGLVREAVRRYGPAVAGVSTIICTDISRDGAMKGTNREMYRELSEKFSSINFIASGGVSSLEDVNALKDMGMYGAIIGKAYYTGAVDLKEAIAAAHKEND